jgi:hypothetical protein
VFRNFFFLALELDDKKDFFLSQHYKLTDDCHTYHFLLQFSCNVFCQYELPRDDLMSSYHCFRLVLLF